MIIAVDACAGFDPGIIQALFIHFGPVSGHVMQTVDLIQWLETCELPIRVCIASLPDH